MRTLCPQPLPDRSPCTAVALEQDLEKQPEVLILQDGPSYQLLLCSNGPGPLGSARSRHWADTKRQQGSTRTAGLLGPAEPAAWSSRPHAA